MKYNFKDILNAAIYENTCVMFIFGKYTVFNDMVGDTLKQMSIDNVQEYKPDRALMAEFGIEVETDDDSGTISNNVDFNTFINVVGVPSINGKWFCRVDLSLLNTKQKERLNEYIKRPSENGILVVISSDWTTYRQYLNNRVIRVSNKVHSIQLDYPNKSILKQLVKQMFEYRGLSVDASAVDLFIIRLSRCYDDYEKVMDDIADAHTDGTVIDSKIMKGYLKGIENYVIDDYIEELMKPLPNDKTNNKKVLRIMAILVDELGAVSVVRQLIKAIEEYIDYRILINKGYIPIGINYFFSEVIKSLPDPEKYKDVPEWKFKKKAYAASMTSINDWEVMLIILRKAVENVKIGPDEMERKCKKALYEISTRSVLTESRVENILGLDNVLTHSIERLNRVQYNENATENG